MVKLITVRKAKEEIKRLQHYVDLVEGYDANTLDKLIIKEYAVTNSIVKIELMLKERKSRFSADQITREYIIAVINGKASDELHRILKSGYLQRIKHNRRYNYNK